MAEEFKKEQADLLSKKQGLSPNLVDAVRDVLAGKRQKADEETEDKVEEGKKLSSKEKMKRGLYNSELDPVNPTAVKKKFKNRKDKDIDNDGDVDSTDKYLHKRRKAISKAISKEDVEIPDSDEKKLKKIVKSLKKSVKGHDNQQKTIQKLLDKDDMNEGTWALPETPREKAELKKLMSRKIELGQMGALAADKLYGLIGDDELFDDLYVAGKRNPKGDARPIIKKFVKKRRDLNIQLEQTTYNVNIRGQGGTQVKAKTPKQASSKAFRKMGIAQRHRSSMQHSVKPHNEENVDEDSAADVLKRRYASNRPEDNPQATKRVKDAKPGVVTHKMHPHADLTDRGYSKKGKMAALKKQHARRPAQYGITREEEVKEGAMSRMDTQRQEKERLGPKKVKGKGLDTFKPKPKTEDFNFSEHFDNLVEDPFKGQPTGVSVTMKHKDTGKKQTTKFPGTHSAVAGAKAHIAQMQKRGFTVHSKNLMYGKNEEAVNELSVKKLSQYMQKSAASVSGKDARTQDKRISGQSMADKKMRKAFGKSSTAKVAATNEMARRGRPPKSGVRKSDDMEAGKHIVMQLRKSVSLRGQHPVEFKSGETKKISSADASKALNIHNRLRTPIEKKNYMDKLHHSHGSFQKALKDPNPGEGPKKRGVSLAGPKFSR